MKTYPNIIDQYVSKMPGTHNGAALSKKKQVALPQNKQEAVGDNVAKTNKKPPTNTGHPRNTQPKNVAMITAPKGRAGYGKRNLGKTKKGFVD